ncbi:MAG: hypothetical protein WDN03_08070 [Rhizomicrobium sp.]
MQNRFGNIGRITPKKLAVLAALTASGRTPVVKPEHFREICAVDISALRGAVRRIGEVEWNAENEKKENDFSCFRQTRHIVGRFNSGPHPEEYHATSFWSRWSDLLVPVMNAVAAHYDMARAGLFESDARAPVGRRQDRPAQRHRGFQSPRAQDSRAFGDE